MILESHNQQCWNARIKKIHARKYYAQASTLQSKSNTMQTKPVHLVQEHASGQADRANRVSWVPGGGMGENSAENTPAHDSGLFADF
jgi:hypothetical protein